MERLSRVHLLTLLLLALAPPAGARVLLSQKDALALAFPGLAVERRTAYLSEEQRKRAEEDGHVKVDSRVWSYYVAASSEGARGYAYFDSHVVRTMPETVMVVVDAGGTVRLVEVLAFAEPDDYLPRRRWLEQFRGQALDKELMVRRKIRNVAGASLTAEAATDAVRRVLAVHALVHGKRVK